MVKIIQDCLYFVDCMYDAYAKVCQCMDILMNLGCHQQTLTNPLVLLLFTSVKGSRTSERLLLLIQLGE